MAKVYAIHFNTIIKKQESLGQSAIRKHYGFSSSQKPINIYLTALEAGSLRL